jgi:hypothetical protein
LGDSRIICISRAPYQSKNGVNPKCHANTQNTDNQYTKTQNTNTFLLFSRFFKQKIANNFLTSFTSVTAPPIISTHLPQNDCPIPPPAVGPIRDIHLLGSSSPHQVLAQPWHPRPRFCAAQGKLGQRRFLAKTGPFASPGMDTAIRERLWLFVWMAPGDGHFRSGNGPTIHGRQVRIFPWTKCEFNIIWNFGSLNGVCRESMATNQEFINKHPKIILNTF